MSEKVLPGVPGKFKRQTHIAGSVLIYVCVLDGNVTVIHKNAATLQIRGKGHGKVFQGVTG